MTAARAVHAEMVRPATAQDPPAVPLTPMDWLSDIAQWADANEGLIAMGAGIGAF